MSSNPTAELTGSPSQPEVLPKNLFGYEVLSKIGTGAASILYAVTKPGSNEKFALKHVLIEEKRHHRFFEQLEAEYKYGRLFADPVLRRSLELKTRRTLLTRKITQAALVMELIDGMPMAMRDPHQLPTILKLLADAARGLEALHRLGLVHCDLKPDNILMCNHGKGVKIIDFGQTCISGTVKRRLQGSPHCISPEQVKRDPVTPQTDVYNFGASIYRVLTGQNMKTVYTRKLNRDRSKDPIRTPIELDPRLPQQVSDLVMRCVRTRPHKRPTMQEVGDGFAYLARKIRKLESGVTLRVSSSDT